MIKGFWQTIALPDGIHSESITNIGTADLY
jgi:hypothetical protein